LSDDEGDDAKKTGGEETAGKQPRQANPKKKNIQSSHAENQKVFQVQII
jgi:hypothetical protein